MKFKYSYILVKGKRKLGYFLHMQKFDASVQI
jgi:hypothetical protein